MDWCGLRSSRFRSESVGNAVRDGAKEKAFTRLLLGCCDLLLWLLITTFNLSTLTVTPVLCVAMNQKMPARSYLLKTVDHS